MSERFTATLRAASDPGWSQAVGHRFVKQLFAGAVPDAVMARYLIQDHRFLDSFLTLLGAVLAGADTFAAKLHQPGFSRPDSKSADGRSAAWRSHVQRAWRNLHAIRAHAGNNPDRAAAVFGHSVLGLPQPTYDFRATMATQPGARQA